MVIDASACLPACVRACVHALHWPGLQDYLFTYYSGLEAVSGSSVLGAAQRWLHPAQQTVVVVADAAQAGPELAKAGLQYTVLPLD